MFVYDEDSRYCYFNPHSFEASEQFFLVGVLLGLAIYNSTILDVALPPVVFQKLLTSNSSQTANKSFTNSNRKEFVDLYVQYLLDTSVAKQFEPFKRGFYTVCGGNALSLFMPDEIELLVRGSDEPLDISAVRAVATYDGWGNDPEHAP